MKKPLILTKFSNISFKGFLALFTISYDSLHFILVPLGACAHALKACKILRLDLSSNKEGVVVGA